MRSPILAVAGMAVVWMAFGQATQQYPYPASRIYGGGMPVDSFSALKKALALTAAQVAGLQEIQKNARDAADPAKQAADPALALLSEDQKMRLTALEAAAKLQMAASQAGKLGLIATQLAGGCFCDYEELRQALGLSDSQLRLLRQASPESRPARGILNSTEQAKLAELERAKRVEAEANEAAGLGLIHLSAPFGAECLCN